jgi:hypothetical protein
VAIANGHFGVIGPKISTQLFWCDISLISSLVAPTILPSTYCLQPYLHVEDCVFLQIRHTLLSFALFSHQQNSPTIIKLETRLKQFAIDLLKGPFSSFLFSILFLERYPEPPCLQSPCCSYYGLRVDTPAIQHASAINLTGTQILLARLRVRTRYLTGLAFWQYTISRSNLRKIAANMR